MMRTSPIALVTLLVLLTAPGTSAQRSEFSGTTTVVAVEVPVNVVRDGEPVRGLVAADFEVLDQGEARPLVDFEVVDLEAIGSPRDEARRQEVPVVARRHFLLLFDLSFSRAKTLERSIAGSRELLASLHGSDRVAAAIFGLAGGVRVLHGFTSNHGQVEHVLSFLEGVVNRNVGSKHGAGDAAGADDPLGLVASPAALAAEIGRAAGVEMSHSEQALRSLAGGGGRGGALLGETLADMAELEAKELVSRRRAEAITFASSLSALSELTRDIDGRKYLVYLSEGFEGQLLETASIFSLGSAGLLRELEKTFQTLRQDGWSIQSVDPGGVRGFDEQFGTKESMVLLAKETGGDFYQNFNNLGTAMESLLEKTGVTYLLVFQSPEIALDGKFHPIKVRLKTGRRAQLRHRPGYFAPRPDDELSPEQLRFSIADKILSGEEGGDFEVAALVRSFRRTDGDGCDVSVWIEADGRRILEGFSGEPIETELYVYALDAEGEVRDTLTRRIKLDPARVEARLAKGGNLKFYGDVHLAPGDYDLRVLLRTASDQRYALRSVPVKVNELSESDPVLLGAVFLDDPGRPSIVVRETEAQEAPGAEASTYPFRMGEGLYFPAVRPRLAAARPTRISLMAYRIEGLLLQKASIVRADGSQVEEGRLNVAGKDSHDGLDQVFFDFSPTGLEPGEYTFHVALVDPRTRATYSADSSFELIASP